jgi:hypothetical protein
MHDKSWLAPVTLLALAACQQQVETAPLHRAPAIQALGPAEDCISTNRIDRTEVHDDFTIDFHMIDDTIYRNTLDGRCASLGFEERFSYKTTTGRLCSIDTIRVLYSEGGEGASCGLGTFLPVQINRD